MYVFLIKLNDTISNKVTLGVFKNNGYRYAIPSDIYRFVRDNRGLIFCRCTWLYSV
ncbi:hypothetical protein [Escherichia coli IS5]|nr:hypothetical protein [Escherichia coli IS5]